MSRLYPFRGLTALVAMLCWCGCEAAKSANPTAPSVAGPIPGVNITAPRAARAVAGSTLIFNGEPPTLLIENAGTSGLARIWLQLEVGTDAGFQQLVYQAESDRAWRQRPHVVSPACALGAGYTYYWRTRAADGANSGPYSAVSSFDVIPPVVIDAPRPWRRPAS